MSVDSRSPPERAAVARDFADQGRPHRRPVMNGPTRRHAQDNRPARPGGTEPRPRPTTGGRRIQAHEGARLREAAGPRRHTGGATPA